MVNGVLQTSRDSVCDCQECVSVGGCGVRQRHGPPISAPSRPSIGAQDYCGRQEHQVQQGRPSCAGEVAQGLWNSGRGLPSGGGQQYRSAPSGGLVVGHAGHKHGHRHGHKHGGGLPSFRM